MKTVIFSREGRDYSRSVTEFVEMFRRKYPDLEVEIRDPDSRESASLMAMLDITSYPAVVVQADDGKVVQLWQGEQLPLLDDVASYALG